jgi:hypothetical protein
VNRRVENGVTTKGIGTKGLNVAGELQEHKSRQQE